MSSRKKISILFIAIYLLTNNLWVVPFVEYYYNFDQIVKNYCVQRDLEENLCMGSCYLNNEVKEAVKKQMYGDENAERPEYRLQRVSSHYITTVVLPTNEVSLFDIFSHYTLHHSNFTNEIPSPPPKV